MEKSLDLMEQLEWERSSQNDELLEYLITMNIEELKNRYKLWAISVVLLTRKLPNEPKFKAVRNQIVRSAPSIYCYKLSCSL
jgi:hypothetical protein